MTHEVVRTRSGGFAMLNREVGEIMHPGTGPLVEAEHLYVRQSRLAERLCAGDRLTLFDVGLGAGSNALVARAVSERAASTAGRLHIVSFERDLDALAQALAFDPPSTFGLDGEPGDAARALLENHAHETARTSWRLAHGDLLEALARETEQADVIFWDPFSPKANPSLWTIAAFSAARRMASPTCTLFTYSSSTRTRIALLLAGWAVGIGDSTGKKEQTTAASVRLCDLERPLPHNWLSRLSRADVPLPLDAPARAIEQVRMLPQFRSASSPRGPAV